MHNDRSAAQALDRYITAQQRQSVAPVQNVDLSDRIFVDELLAQLEHDTPDAAVVAALEAHVVQHATTQQAYAPLRRQASHMYEYWRAWIGSRRSAQSHASRRFMQRMSLRFAVMMIVVLSVIGVLPVAAQAILTYFAPREVTSLPPPACETVEARPTALRWVERTTLEQQAGFSVLAPTTFLLTVRCVNSTSLLNRRLSISPMAVCGLLNNVARPCSNHWLGKAPRGR